MGVIVFFQAEDGIRDLVRSRGLGDVYKRQNVARIAPVRWLRIGQLDPPTDFFQDRSLAHPRLADLSLIHI